MMLIRRATNSSYPPSVRLLPLTPLSTLRQTPWLAPVRPSQQCFSPCFPNQPYALSSASSVHLYPIRSIANVDRSRHCCHRLICEAALERYGCRARHVSLKHLSGWMLERLYVPLCSQGIVGLGSVLLLVLIGVLRGCGVVLR